MDYKIRESSKISGIYIIETSASSDIRGNIWTSFLKNEFENILPKQIEFKHDKFSTSNNNVLRGIHGDKKSWKLVTCVYGDIQQVVVDLREESSTYLLWEDFSINQDNQLLILIPPNMGNAYYVKSEKAVYHYKLAYRGQYADVEDQFSIQWNDSRIGIKWLSNNPILSKRDAEVINYE